MEVDLVLECLVKAMFHPSTEHLGTHDPHSLRQVTETFLEVAKRAPDKAAERLALFLQVTESWVNMAMGWNIHQMSAKTRKKTHMGQQLLLFL